MNSSSRIRRILLDLAMKRQHPGTGSAREFLIKRTTNKLWPNLNLVLEPLNWAVVGAVATRLYMPERATLDFEIIIHAVDGKEARRKLSAAGFIYRGELSVGGSSWTTPEGESVDVLESKDKWLTQALEEAQTNKDAQGLPIMPLQYLALMKFRAGRVQDLADITRMLGQADDTTLDAVRTVFAEYHPSDIEDLESMITLGKLEMQSTE